MESHPAAKLTEAEREVLRLWPYGKAKEIARELGISHHTVNDRLRSARNRLRVETSDQAARLLADFEGRPAPNRVVHNPPTVAQQPDQEMLVSSEEDGGWQPRSTDRPSALREGRTPYSEALPLEARLSLLVSRFRGTRHDLKITGLLRSAGLLMLIIIMVVAGLIAIAGGVVQLVRQLIH